MNFHAIFLVSTAGGVLELAFVVVRVAVAAANGGVDGRTDFLWVGGVEKGEMSGRKICFGELSIFGLEYLISF